MPLVSASQMSALQAVAETGFITPVTLRKRVFSENVYGDEQTESFPVSGSAMGWLRSMPAGVLDVISGAAGDVADFRLFLPVGTDISNGDRVEIDGRQFIVQDTAKESTYQVLLRVFLRRVE